jgi:hypothetical protein
MTFLKSFYDENHFTSKQTDHKTKFPKILQHPYGFGFKQNKIKLEIKTQNYNTHLENPSKILQRNPHPFGNQQKRK